jgi:hypothetical protein
MAQHLPHLLWRQVFRDRRERPARHGGNSQREITRLCCLPVVVSSE